MHVDTEGAPVGLLRDRSVFVAVAAGGRFSGERARQPDFLTPYLRLCWPLGLLDLRFFSGTGAGPDIVSVARTGAQDALDAHFSSLRI